MNQKPPIGKTNEDLLRDWEEWLQSQGGEASLENVFASGNHLLFAGMLLKNFRRAAREAVFDTFKLEARERGFTDADSSTAAFFFIVDQIADAWSLTDEQKIRLLDCGTAAQLDHHRAEPFSEISVETLERAAILLDIYIVLHSIFADPVIADDWIQLPNHAPMFGGRSALTATLKERV